MKSKQTQPAAAPRPATGSIGDLLFAAVIFAVVALRSAFIETPVHGRLEPFFANTPEALSLALTTVLLFALLLWTALRTLHPASDRIRSGLGLAAGVFTLVSFLAVLVASDKRAALSDAATLSVPLLLAVGAVEVFRDRAKLRLFLWILIALGVMAVYQEYEQATQDNELLVRSYEENPEQFLEQLNIEPGSLQQWQLEHRIHSKDIRGFLRTSNSTASFLLLGCFAAFGLTAQQIRQYRALGSPVMLVLYAVLTAVLLFGIVLGRSRGAIGAGALALGGFVLSLCFGPFLWKHRRLILLAVLLGAVLVGGLVISYGLTHGRLPGPNALLVRWQYWHATAQMLADHPLLGVGGGNFAEWYPRYKIPAAPETVRDPHNFILAVFSQYGILGLAALTALFALPLRRLLRQPEIPNQTIESDSSVRPGLYILLLILPVLLVVRLWFSEGRIDEPDPAQRSAYYLIAYIIPAAVFAIVFNVLLLAVRRTKPVALPSAPLACGLTWGLVAVLIHNLIDFAIFETIVWTVFWLIFAALISLTLPLSPAGAPVISRPWLRVGALAVAGGVFIAVVFLPPWQAGRWMQRSLQQPDQAREHLALAAQADPLAVRPLLYSGQTAVSQALYQPSRRKALLDIAVEDFKQAALRNPATFIVPKQLMEAWRLRAETAEDPNAKQEYLANAYESGLAAHERYPGSDDIAFQLGRLAEQFDRPHDALAWYRLAVEIEYAYRAQFAEMYPDYDLYSRLGQDRFEYARGYILMHSE